MEMRRDRVRNSTIAEYLQGKPVEKVIEEPHLEWLWHLYRMRDCQENYLNSEYLKGKSRIGYPHLTWNEQGQQVAERRGIQWNKIKI